MDLFELFFGVGPAIQSIFKLGFIPKEEDFKELTDEQYESYCRQVDEVKEGEKLYMLLPDDFKNNNKVFAEYGDALAVVSEYEKGLMMKAVAKIERYAEGKNFMSEESKLRYVATQLPDVFSKGTPYQRIDDKDEE